MMSTRHKRAGGPAAGLLVLAVAAVCSVAAQPAKTLRQAEVVDSMPAPRAIRGLGGADAQFWGIDPQKGALLRFSVADKRVVGTLVSRVAKPKALAWDGKTLWCASDQVDKVHQIDSTDGRILNSVDIPKPKGTSPMTLEGLAWDGKYLWVAISAGWSSRLLRLDVANGRVVQSMFAEGLPRALASDGKSLWMATYNQGKSPSVLARWTLLDDSVKMSLTHTFVARLPGKEPVGLAYDRGTFWYADRELRTIQKIRLPADP